LYRRQVVVVEVAGTPMCAMTYVGHRIQASATQMAARRPAPSHGEYRSEAGTPARGRRAPCPDGH
jgi:hypothetical protein